MRDIIRQSRAIAVVVLLIAAAGACAPSQMGEISTTNLIPRVEQLSRPDWLTYSGGKNEFELRPVAAGDLVSADGQCAAAAAAAPPPASGESVADAAQAGLVSGGIALQMTECDVVRRVGAPEQLQIGAETNGERSVVISYVRASRPGVYRFVAGRLISIEGSADAPTARAAPKAKTSKKKPKT